MIQYYTFNGDLNIGQYKTISVQTQLEVATRDGDDEYAEDDPNDPPENYTDGVRVVGELSFDASPIQYLDKHPVKQGVVAQLTLRHEGDSSRFNILLLERTGITDVVPKKIKRYFWMFFAIGKPMFDGLEIFPKGYKGKNVNRVFTCTNFKGVWPVGVSAVVVARDKRQARQLLNKQLEEKGLPITDYTLEEVSLEQPAAVILNDGDY